MITKSCTPTSKSEQAPALVRFPLAKVMPSLVDSIAQQGLRCLHLHQFSALYENNGGSCRTLKFRHPDESRGPEIVEKPGFRLPPE